MFFIGFILNSLRWFLTGKPGQSQVSASSLCQTRLIYNLSENHKTHMQERYKEFKSGCVCYGKKMFSHFKLTLLDFCNRIPVRLLSQI